MTLVTAAIARGSPIRSFQRDAARAIGSNGSGADAVMTSANLSAPRATLVAGWTA